MQINEIKKLKLGLTNRCNGKCIMCWHSNKTQRTSSELPVELYRQIRDTLFSNLTTLEVISGGEIFLCSWIEEFLSDIAGYDLLLKVDTNGSIISDRHKELLKRLNVELVISLDASLASLHNYLRTNCSFEKVIESIKFFVANGKRVYLRMCVSNHNFYEMHKVLELAENLGVYGVIFQTVQYLDSVERPYQFKKPPVDMHYVASLRNSKVKFSIRLDYYHKSMEYASWVVQAFSTWLKMKKSTYCPQSKEFLKIDVDGKVLSCSMDGAAVFGDLNRDPLTEIICSERCEQLRRTCSCPKMEAYLRR